MPVIKSAKKKLRQDKKTTLARAKVEATLKETIKKAVATPTDKTVRAAVSLIDKAAKKHIMHANKAARIKSRLAHMLNPKATTKPATAEKKTVKPTVKAKKSSTKKSIKK